LLMSVTATTPAVNSSHNRAGATHSTTRKGDWRVSVCGEDKSPLALGAVNLPENAPPN